MLSVLIVDDEPQYGDLISRGLREEVLDTHIATTGRKALDIGVRLRPDLLITDWMLRGPIHGLHVASALGLVFDNLPTILITGFPSDDVRNSAQRVKVDAFMEKPFSMNKLRDAVRQILESPPPPTSAARLGMLELDQDQKIVFANDQAKRLLSASADWPASGADTATASLTNVLRFEGGRNQWSNAITHWVHTSPAAGIGGACRFRVQEPACDQTRICLLVSEEQYHYVEDAHVRMLLDIDDFFPRRWPFGGRILLVDDHTIMRRMAQSLLESLGATCYTADSAEQALELLRNDPGLQFVLLDFNIPGCDVSRFVQSTRQTRPETMIVGTSGENARATFREMGIPQYVAKPWRAGDLLDALAGRLGHCVECGLLLPLRHALPKEPAADWACAFCGSQYRAVRDASFPEEITQNAKPLASPQVDIC